MKNSSIAVSAGVHAGTIRETFALLRETGRWWLIPMVTIFFGVCVLLMLLTAAEYIAPFVYTIF